MLCRCAVVNAKKKEKRESILDECVHMSGERLQKW